MGSLAMPFTSTSSERLTMRRERGDLEESMPSYTHPPAKRARTLPQRGGDDYKAGSILEIELENFMTFNHVKMKPAPRLNLVLGPNGTGKSSIVCAIGIGLAGEPQLLGRASQIGDFVKRGEDSGSITITLRGGTPNEVVMIKRKINKRNKSEWFFNDRPVTKKEVQEKVQKYNIQLNNLTQFLPQDRVCEFAKLTPVQLLEETEKAVGNPELSRQRLRLIERNQEMMKIQVALSSHESSLAHAEASNAELESDKQRMHQRKELLNKAASMKKKLPWLNYDEKKASFEQAKETETVAEIKFRDLEKLTREIRASFELLKARKDKAKGASEKSQNLRTQTEQNVRQAGDKETELSAKVRTKLADIQEVHRKEAARQERIEKAQKDVQEAEAALASLPEYQSREEVLASLRTRINDLHMEEGDKKIQRQEKEDLMSLRRREQGQSKQRLQNINAVNTRLLQALRQSGAHQISNAYDWVQSNRHQFRDEVFGPVLLEVRIDNKEHAKYVENQVAQYIWKAFVTQNAEDRDLLVRNLREFDIPVINQKSGQYRQEPRAVTPEMRQIGIHARLDEVIEAPAVVKTLLIGQAGLDNSFIGTSETDRLANQAYPLGVKDLWTPENHHRWQESRYGNRDVTGSATPVRPVRLFSENVDLREKNELEGRIARLDHEINQIQEVLKEILVQGRAVHEEIGKLERQKDEIFSEARLEKKRQQDARNLIEQRRRKVVNLEKEEVSADAETRLRADVKRINAERVGNLITLKELLTKAGEIHTRYAAEHLRAIELDAKEIRRRLPKNSVSDTDGKDMPYVRLLQTKEQERDVQKHTQEAREAESIFTQCRKFTEDCRRLLARAKATAEEQASLTPELQQQFATMPDLVEELQDAIQDCEAQAAAVICNNENAILIYEQRCEEIRNLKAKAEEKRAALETCMKEIDSLQSSWLPQLRQLVSSINETFGRNFMEMAVAGEVSLDEHGTDFDKYGILIKVKFRESASLQVLSAHHQSGGERSVSTILYLVSLQNLTYCPFRVVDEINQGMDPNNERKMFQQLVRAASRPNTPQCFLLTPKLLPDLVYTEACSVLNIMNGHGAKDAAENSGWRDGGSYSQVVMSQ